MVPSVILSASLLFIGQTESPATTIIKPRELKSNALWRLWMFWHSEKMKASEELINDIRSLKHKGVSSIKNGDYASAEATLNEALEQASQYPELGSLQSRILHELGVLEAAQGNSKLAREFFHQALKLESKLGEEITQSITLLHLASLEKKQQQFKKGIATYKQALALQKKNHDDEGAASTLHHLAKLSVRTKNIPSAINFYQQVRDSQAYANKPDVKAAALHQFAMLRYKQNQFEEALVLYEEALELEDAINNPFDKAATLFQMGRIYERQNYLDRALALYQNALDLREGNPFEQASTLHQIGVVKAKQGNFNEAIEIYQKAVELKAEQGNYSSMAITLARLGKLQAEWQGEFKTALKNLHQAVDILQQAGSSEAPAACKVLATVEALANGNGE
ncbi:MAG: tetratricopeptide repeat protein [Symploca sp. SIO2C1]|nr:tetratricopeptide repeat protein [Symploca sp. SIO2C1]